MRVLFSVFAICVIVYHASQTATGDEPGSWAPFEVCSDNGEYCAAVGVIDGDAGQPWDRSYRLSVTKVSDNGRINIWSAPYIYDGYPGGLMAADGKTFVYVSFWYYPDSAVVRIYREGQRFDLDGAVFGIASSMLVDTVSHKLWLTEDRSPYALVDNDTLLIHTRDGNRHSIRLLDGKLN